jgi:hypothetical protein
MKNRIYLFLITTFTAFFTPVQASEIFISSAKDLLRLELQNDRALVVESVDKSQIFHIGQDVVVQSDVVLLNAVADTKKTLVCSVLFIKLNSDSDFKSQKIDCY